MTDIIDENRLRVRLKVEDLQEKLSDALKFINQAIDAQQSLPYVEGLDTLQKVTKVNIQTAIDYGKELEELTNQVLISQGAPVHAKEQIKIDNNHHHEIDSNLMRTSI